MSERIESQLAVACNDLKYLRKAVDGGFKKIGQIEERVGKVEKSIVRLNTMQKVIWGVLGTVGTGVAVGMWKVIDWIKDLI